LLIFACDSVLLNGISTRKITAGLECDMAEKWYYQAFGQDFGPLSLEDLARMLAEGELSEDDLVREGTRGSWSSAGATKILTEKAATIAVATAEVATDIDSFMLMDEKSGSKAEFDQIANVNFEVAPAAESRGVWYFQSLGQDFGPVPFGELLEMAKRKDITPEDSVRKGDGGQWVPAGLIDGLFPDEFENATADDLEDLFSVSMERPSSVARNPAPSKHSKASEPVAFESTSQYQAKSAPVIAQMPVPVLWYCYVNDQEVGPVALTDLQDYAATGQITPEVYVRYGADGEWVQAAQIPELYAPSTEVPLVQAPAYQPVAPAYQQPAATAAALAGAVPATLAEAERLELAQQIMALLKREMMPLGSSAPAGAGGWFCNISGSIMGPVTIDALVQMVLQKRIFADDMIRLGATGEWFPAKTVPELFPPEAGPGKKKSGLDGGESVLSRIDKMYRDAQEAKEKQESEDRRSGTPMPPTKPVGSEPPKPSGDVLRNLNNNIARAATMSPKDRPKSSSSSSSGGGTMGEQLDDLLGMVGLRGKGLYVLIAVAVIGVGGYFSPFLLQGFSTSASYEGLVAIHAQIKQARENDASPESWQKQVKDIKKRIKGLQAKVKGGAQGSTMRDVAKMGTFLSTMADLVTEKAPPGTPPEEDEYLNAERGFKETKAKLNKKGVGKK
jgi:hypothetical protein